MGRRKGSLNKIKSIVDDSAMKRRIKVARKYKINRPSMLEELRAACWYKFQFYDPSDKYADDFGYVHFKSKARMFDHIKGRVRATEAPSKLKWFILGMCYAGLILAFVLWLKGFR